MSPDTFAEYPKIFKCRREERLNHAARSSALFFLRRKRGGEKVVGDDHHHFPGEPSGPANDTKRHPQISNGMAAGVN